MISEELPAHDAGEHISNSDPVTGQAGWYDVQVRVYKADPNEPEQTSPQFENQLPVPGQPERKSWLSYFAGKKPAKLNIGKRK